MGLSYVVFKLCVILFDKVLCIVKPTEEESEEEAPPPKKTPAKATPAKPKAAPAKAEESDDDDDGKTFSIVLLKVQKKIILCIFNFL